MPKTAIQKLEVTLVFDDRLLPLLIQAVMELAQRVERLEERYEDLADRYDR